MLKPVITYRSPWRAAGKENRIGEASLPPVVGADGVPRIFTTERVAQPRFHLHSQEGHCPLLSEQADALGMSYGRFVTPEIPNWWYFNPGLYEHDGLWLVPRKTQAPLSPKAHWVEYLSGIVRMRLNNDMTLGPEEPLIWPNRHISEQTDDPRMSVINGRVHLAACCWITPQNKPALKVQDLMVVHQTLAELDGWRVNRLIDVPYGGNNATLSAGPRAEKNWLWFEHDGAKHFVYMTHPHNVLRVDDAVVTQTFQTDTHIDWPHGEIRGGTPPVRVGDEFFSFFHSSVGWAKVHGAMRNRYYMGAYAFEARPPFKVTRYTRRPILIGTLREPSVLMSPPCVFPSGALLRGDQWLVTLGVNDALAGWLKSSNAIIERMMDKA